MSDSEETSAAPSRKRGDAAPATAPAEQPAAAKKTVEEWATEKKFLPKQFPGTPPQQDGQRVTPGTGPKPNPNYERFYAAKCGKGWVVGAEVTEAEFDEAMKLIDKPI